MTGTFLARGLFFNEEALPRLMERIHAPRYRALWDEISVSALAVARAGSLMLEGDTFSEWYYARTRLMDLSLYVMLTGDEACAKALCAILRELCGRDIDFWQGPHYPNRPRTLVYKGEELLAGELETAQLAMGISIAYDWAYRHLDETTRQCVKTALRDKARMLLRHSVRFQSEKWVMNHLCVISTGLALSAMLLGEDEHYQDDLAISRHGLELWMEKIEDDGSYGEAYHYWAYPVNCLFFGLFAFRRVLGQELSGADRLRRCLSWALYNQVGKHHIPGFDRPVAVAVNNYDCPYLFQMEAPEALLFSGYFGMPLGQWYIERFLLDAPPRPDSLHRWWHACPSILFALDDDSAPSISPQEACMSPSAYFADTGYVFIRDGWERLDKTGGDTVLALQSGGGGRSRSHEHYDKNSFSLYAGGEYLICDPGHSCYRGESHLSYDTATRAHNTLHIADENQTLSFLERGMLHDEAIAHPSYNNQAVIVGKNFQKGIAYIASEAAQCYTPYLRQFTRHILYVRPDFFLVWDRVDTGDIAGAAKNGFNINNMDGKTNIETRGNSIHVHRPLQNLHIHYLEPEILSFDREDAKLHLAYHTMPDRAVEGKWGSAIRLTPRVAGPNKTDYIYILYPHEKGEAPLCAMVESLERRNGLVAKAAFSVTCRGESARFAIDGEDLLYQGAKGESYRF